MIVSTPRDKIWAWMNNRIQIAWSEDLRLIGEVRNDCIVAAVAYNAFIGRTCFMHGAIDNPHGVSRTFREAVFEYPFVDLQLECLMGLIDSSNAKSLNNARRLGFVELNRLPGSGTGGCDLVAVRLFRREWKAQYELRKRAQGT